MKNATTGPSRSYGDSGGTFERMVDTPVRAAFGALSKPGLAIAAALVLTACGGGGETSSATPADSAAATSVADTTAETAAAPATETPAETVADEPVGDGAGENTDGCGQVLTPEEIDSILGTSIVEIKGSGQFCNVIFASDAVGSLAAFSGSRADEAIDTLLADYKADGTAGVLLDDGRGYVYRSSAVVRGDSGRVFRFDAPDSIDTPDVQVAMQDIADLLLTR